MKNSIFHKILFLVTALLVIVVLAPTAVFAQIRPAAPDLLSGIPTSGSVPLYWRDNSLDETSFVVERAPDVGGLGPGTYSVIGTAPARTGTSQVSVLMYTDTTVIPQTAYWYRVAAVNGAVQSFYSNQTRILTSVSAPQIFLTGPVGASFTSGAGNLLSANTAVSGTTIVSAEYQLIANNAPGVFDARDILEIRLNKTILSPRATTSTNNTMTMPLNLPAGCIAEFDVRGTVSAVNTGTGEWQIGTPAVFVYESVPSLPQSTKFIGSRIPRAGDSVKVIAYRNITGGPLVAETITYIAPNQPAGAASLVVNFLFDGVVQQAQAPDMSAGYLISGEIWPVWNNITNTTGYFRIDAPYFPAYIDPNVGKGVDVTVRFGVQPGEVNIARQIFNPALPAIATTTDIHPLFNSTSVNLNVPPIGTWLYIIVDGVVSAYDNVLGVWTVGNEQIKCYQTANSLISPATVGDEVLFFCVRTLTPGPLVIESTFNILAGPLIQPYKATAIDAHLMYNGVIQSMNSNVWMVGPPGQPQNAVPFIVDDQEGKARIDPLPFSAFQIGMPVTVEFEHVGEVIPDDANWAPMTQTATNVWSATVSLPAVPVPQNGKLFLRTFDATGQGSTSAYTASLVAMPTSAPLPAPTLTTLTITQTSVGLSWTDSANEDSYSVQRSSDGVNWSTTSLATLPANTVSYTDSTVIMNTTYFYRIAATNVLGTTYSNTLQVAVPNNPPSAPTNFNAAAGAGGEINLSWTDTATNETGFVIERSTNNFVTVGSTFNVPTNTVSYMDISVTPATDYWYRVYAVNNLGPSTITATIMVTTAVEQPLPAAPTLAAILQGSTQINLTWTVDNATSTGNVSGFRVMRSVDNFATAGTLLATLAPSVLNYNNPGLGYSTTYYYQVVAFNVTGDNVSNTASAITGAVPVGGGGGGGGIPPVALSGLSGSLTVYASGLVSGATQLTGTGVVIDIAAGTILRNAQGNAINSMALVSPGTLPIEPPSGYVVVMTINLGPDGATFTPPLTLTLTYNPANVPVGVDEQKLEVGRWNGTAWTMLNTTVDTQANTTSAPISGFSYFTVLAPKPAATPTPTPTTVPPTSTSTPPTATPTTTPPTTTPPITTPTSTTTTTPTTPGTGGGPNWWLIGILIAAGVILVVIMVILLVRGRKP